MSRIKKSLITLVATFALLVPFTVPVAVSAQNIQENICTGANFGQSSNCSGDQARQSVNSILTTVINIFSLVVGFVSVVMIIIGGFKYITSGGDSGNVTGAKNTILYAVIGLVVVALAQIIVRFVLEQTATV
jgi:hypothetical protein